MKECEQEYGCYYTLKDCNDGNACTDDCCDSETGCTHTPVNCDYNSCTTE